jgi:hypothetical protein
MPSPFITVRYPDDAWELTDPKNVPKVGDVLRRSGGSWVVATAVVDTSGHLIVTWRRASRGAAPSDVPVVGVRP